MKVKNSETLEQVQKQVAEHADAAASVRSPLAFTAHNQADNPDSGEHERPVLDKLTSRLFLQRPWMRELV